MNNSSKNRQKEIKWCMQKEEQVSFLAEKIRQADAVLIGDMRIS